MEVTLKDESGVSPSSILEKTIALTNEVQVKSEPPALDVLEQAATDLETVPENKVLRMEGEPVPVGEKIVNAVNSAVGAVVDGVKGLVESVKSKTDGGDLGTILQAENKVISTEHIQEVPEPVFQKCKPILPLDANSGADPMLTVEGAVLQGLTEPQHDSGEAAVDTLAVPDPLPGSVPKEAPTPMDALHVFIPIGGPEGVKVEQLSPTVCLVQDKFLVEAVQVRLPRCV